MTDTEFILDSITWSFSSVRAYAQCPLQFRLVYIDALPKINNAFAEWGTFCHLLLEQFYRGKLPGSALAEEYQKGYQGHIKQRFPYNEQKDLNRSYYEAGLAYFTGFAGDFPTCEILSVEQKIRFSVGGYPFIGFIDLILRDKTDGKIILCDHKSKAKFKTAAEKKEYLRQLYLYAPYIKKVYGAYPKTLLFNMFRIGEQVKEPFCTTARREAEAWFCQTIAAIYRDTTFEARPNSFFCDQLCSAGQHCPHSRRCREDAYADRP
ncbi:MAG TPA: hypothetical protein DD391_07405 [Clostridiales bacterium]|jgi:RecB family exonuclease|nr:PD-(D/E)XK nuclease family protein [Clostridiales bacterium]HBL82406.1 hypothetical protein [Clostridiales bacterium]